MSGWAAEVEAQAKVNLRLRILAREEGGYHQLETLFLRLALADTVRVRRTDLARTLDVSGVEPGSLGPVERNLAWRAAESYAVASGWRGGWAIELEKRIPVGGGLGGGSADAGAVLRVMDALSARPVGEPRLLDIAARLGADVPFLATTHPYALAWGRGERMLALAPPPVRGVVLVVPPFAVSTAEAYGWLASARSGRRADTRVDPALDMGALTRWESLAALATNDFEPVVAARHPELERITAALRTLGCAPAILSGSGSVVFGVLSEGASRPLADGMTLGHVVMTESAARVEAVRRLD